MRALPLLLLTLLAGPAAAQETGAAVACKEDNIVCREDCSTEYGSSSRAYGRLSSCLQRCKKKYDLCRDRHFALQERKNLGIEDIPSPASPPAQEAPRRYSTSEEGLSDGDATAAGEDSVEEKPAAASRSEATEPGVRRGVYRASESEPEPAEPEPEPEPVADSQSKDPSRAEPTPGSKFPAAIAAEPEPLIDEAPPPPPPPPKPKAPERPLLPPEPKKDISEWDPDGD